MEREGGNGERMRKCRESISLYFLILSPFPLHFLILSPFPLHFLFLSPFSLHFLILSPFPRSPAPRLQRVAQPCDILFQISVQMCFENVSGMRSEMVSKLIFWSIVKDGTQKLCSLHPVCSPIWFKCLVSAFCHVSPCILGVVVCLPTCLNTVHCIWYTSSSTNQQEVWIGKQWRPP